MYSKLLLVAALSGAFLSPVVAQAKWTTLSPATSPVKRGNAQATTDDSSMFVFAGNLSGTVFYNDLWSFDGSKWAELSKDKAAGAPPARRWGSIAYDFARKQVLVFGGQDVAKKNLSDTWTWNGTKWTKHSLATAPSARRWHAMGYDWKNSRVILFGGSDGTSVFGDTWAWDGSKWTKLAPTNSPAKTCRHAMAAKKAAQEIVMYGGATLPKGPWGYSAKMWTWDGSNWSQATTKNAPYTTGVISHPMVWDALRERLVVFGGYNGSEKGDTYEFHGDTWTKRTFTTDPVARSGGSMGYVPAANKSFLFGGYAGPSLKQQGDTWEYQTNAVATVKTSGTGCAGAGGIPTISMSLPWIDDSVNLSVGNIGSGASSMLIIGASKTTWNGNSLPYDLGVMGYPSCNLLVSMDFLALGLSSAKVTIPNQASLVGREFFLQAVSMGPGNRIGVSARTEIRSGAR
jgi:hypothetical protein